MQRDQQQDRAPENAALQAFKAREVPHAWWSASSVEATPAVREQLSALGQMLGSQRQQVLDAWRSRAERDPLLASSSRWSRRQFEDHVPEIVDVLCAKLGEWPVDTREADREHETAERHSKHRWQQGYDLRSLTREWGHLNAVLVAAIDHYERAVPPSEDVTDALSVARSVIAEIVLESTGESAREYSRLLQTEAAVRAREMESAIEQLREDERARSVVLRQAAHDIRGSLGIVTGSASIIDRETMRADERAQVHGLLQRGVRSLHQMMTDLIDLARLEAGEEQAAAEDFDAASLLRDLCATAQPLAQEKGLSLICQGPDSLPKVGDATNVQRIAQNLLLNAIKYTHQGHVTLSWGDDDEADSNGRWWLAVQDTGPGLERTDAAPLVHELEESTRLAREAEQPQGAQNPEPPNFPPLSATPTAPPMPEGETPEGKALHEQWMPSEGVGLSIVKRLCDLLHATLEVDSSPEQGSRFRVVFLKAQTGSAQGG
jgi:signal transduction histidine kinase